MYYCHFNSHLPKICMCLTCFFVYWKLFSLIFFLNLRLALKIQLFSFLLWNLLQSTPSYSTQLDARSWTLSGKHEYLAAAASHQLSDQIGVAGSEERRYQTAERRGPTVRRGSHLSLRDEPRQHQTRIKSTNRTDPGWPGGVLTTLWRGEYLASWEGDSKRGEEHGKKKWDKWMKGWKVHSRRQLCKKVQEAAIPNLYLGHPGNMK